MSRDDNPDVTLGEQADLREAGIAVQLPERLAALRDRIVAAFAGRDAGAARPDAGAAHPDAATTAPIEFEALGFRGELTLVVPPDRVLDVLAFCRDDPEVRCELLADLSAVHWPGGVLESQPEETTGWPTYSEERPGSIEVDYILYSVEHHHRLRLRTSVPDEDPRLRSATELYRSADFMEREVYDFFGVTFDGHPDLRRIEMPDGWEGHPQRKDYPLGGVEVEYKGATVPPPDERSY